MNLQQMLAILRNTSNDFQKHSHIQSLEKNYFFTFVSVETNWNQPLYAFKRYFRILK